MVIYLGLALLIGLVSGLRTFTSIAAVSWGARFHRIPLEHTGLAFLGFAATPYVATLLALGELIGDKLPSTPSRKLLLPFLARIASGSLCGACMGIAGAARANSATAPWLIAGLVVGAAGSIAGTVGGSSFRALLAIAFGKDFPAALIEDAIAMVLAFIAILALGRL